MTTQRMVPAAWDSEIKTWRVALQAVQLSPRTIELRGYHIERLGRDRLASSPWQLTRDALLTWTGSQPWGRETTRAVRSSFRRFWAWGVATERTTENIADVLPMIRAADPQPRPARRDRVERAIASADARVVLIMRLANELGMRRAEVAQIRPENDLVKDLVGWSLIVHGKGSRNRVIPIPGDLAAQLRAAPSGYLFPNDGGGHLTPQWIGKLVSRALADGTTMHQLRHLCATEMHEQTKDLRLVQSLLGHASLATTQRYVAVDNTKMRAAVAERSKRWQSTGGHAN